MGNIFFKLLNNSITAGWLILVVLCIRFLFRKMPKWVGCLLWGVVAIRLILPFSIESMFSLQPSAEPIKSSTTVEGEILPYVPSVDSDLAFVERLVNPMLAENFAYEETNSAAPLQVVMEIAGFFHLCGMLVLLIFAVGSMIKLYLLVRESVHYKENIFICDAVKSPFILGIVKPKIYLSSSLSEGEMDYIIAHEKAHLSRKDYIWKPLGYLLLCVYWFNPLCLIAYKMLCKDIELACDEKVIRDLDLSAKKEYSRVLLSCATGRRLVFACPLAFGEVGVKERVKSVLKYKKPAIWLTGLAIVICLVVAICFLTNPVEENQEEFASIEETNPDDFNVIVSQDQIVSEDSPNENGPDTIEEGPQTGVLADYHFTVGEYDGYNAILEVNGYEYRFNLGLDTTKVEIVIGKETDKDKYGSTIKAFPVAVSDGAKEIELGYIHGFNFTVTSTELVLPKYSEDDKICGQIVSCKDGKITIRTAKEVDRDTYVEFIDISESLTEYEISDDVEYIMLDVNFVNTPVTYPRFLEHIRRNADTVYYLFIKEGKVSEIWEPYIP